MVCIHNAKVVLETGILWDGVILLDGDRIAEVGERREIEIPADCEMIDAKGAYVGPGFVDIHVHGGNGHMFDAEPLQAAEHFLKNGETTILATLYYNLSKEGFLDSIKKVQSAMAAGGAGDAIAGIYMEGPYMNPKFGAMPERNKWKGAIAEEAYKEVVDLAGTDVFVWSVAPEREGIEEFVKYAGKVNPHAVFAVGHSEATPAQVRKMKRYGLCLQTHCMDATGNYSEWVGTRGAGPDEACLTDPDMYAELICDSGAVHVNKDLINLIVHTKGVDKVILITDSFVSDLPAPEKLKHITDLIFDENCWLSGSKLTMNVACRNLMSHTNCGIAQAFLMASRNPARAIGLEHEIGTIESGKRANLVFVDDMFNVQKVVLGGKVWQQ